MHAICQDTYPTICYMNEYSRMIIKLCTKINKEHGEIVAYSVDAGSHVFLFTMNEHVDYIKEQLQTLDPDGDVFDRII